MAEHPRAAGVPENMILFDPNTTPKTPATIYRIGDRNYVDKNCVRIYVLRERVFKSTYAVTSEALQALYELTLKDNGARVLMRHSDPEFQIYGAVVAHRGTNVYFLQTDPPCERRRNLPLPKDVLYAGRLSADGSVYWSKAFEGSSRIVADSDANLLDVFVSWRDGILTWDVTVKADCALEVAADQVLAPILDAIDEAAAQMASEDRLCELLLLQK